MSVLQYNGISLQVVKTVRYDKQPIYDGPTYLYTRHVIRVQAVYNPKATSYVLTPFVGLVTPGTNAPLVNPPLAQAGSNPALTELAIKHTLMQPRNQLLYTAAGDDASPTTLAGNQLTILQSPTTNSAGTPYSTDCTTGPTPLACNVWRVDGQKTFRVEYSIQTDVNECDIYVTKPPVLLSNRWDMTHDIDQDAYSTRIIRGRAVFRGDVLRSQALVPDDFRGFLIHPVPYNFRRDKITVTPGDDGCSVTYTVIDREQTKSILFSSISRVECYWHLGYHKVDAEAIAHRSAMRLFRSSASAVRTFSKAHDPVSGAISAAAELAIDAAGDAAGALYDLLPKTKVTLITRVWGYRATARQTLINIMGYVIKTKIPWAYVDRSKPFGPNLQALGYGYDSDFMMDEMGRYAELRLTYDIGPISGQLGAVTSGGADAPFGQTSVGLPNRFPELFNDDVVAYNLLPGGPGGTTIIDKTNPKIVHGDPTTAYSQTYPGQHGTWGTWLAEAVAQALDVPCTTPLSPPNSATNYPPSYPVLNERTPNPSFTSVTPPFHP